MFAPDLQKSFYKNILRPAFFKKDAEFVHDKIINLGNFLEKTFLTRGFVRFLFSFEDKSLEKEIDGIRFKNPVGLAAGFDYDGRASKIMTDVGFGFNTVGTVTARPYRGNKKPRLGRLPKSKSLLVNKGFKSIGADAVEVLLDGKNFQEEVIGLSVGSSNIPEINTIQKAVDDYIYTFKVFRDKEYIKYFELNISCPNTFLAESFADKTNLKFLLDSLTPLQLSKPVYIKMPNETNIKETNELTDLAIQYGYIKGFIFSNLVKKRNNPAFDKEEIQKISSLKGNFSGLPTRKNSNKLIKNAKERYRNDFTIIGCGGIFDAEGAKEKLDLGADLVQLITGVVYGGPQLIGKINQELAPRK